MAAHHFGEVFNEPVEFVNDLAALRALTGADSDSRDPDSSAPGLPVQEFPANDTPLQVPPEIDRLRHRKDRPVSA
jgi:hypothetical protein